VGKKQWLTKGEIMFNEEKRQAQELKRICDNIDRFANSDKVVDKIFVNMERECQMLELLDAFGFTGEQIISLQISLI
jgi:hypothetical protein